MGPLTAKNVAFKNHDKGEGRGANTLTNRLLALVERPRVETRVENFWRRLLGLLLTIIRG